MTQLRGLIVGFESPADLTLGGRTHRMKFRAGGVEVPGDPSRVKLLVEHERGTVIGHGVDFEETDKGLVGVFHLDEAVEDYVVHEVEGRLLDGLSPGLDFDDASRERLRHSRNGAPYADAVLREVSLVAIPAFVDARAEVVS